MRREIQFIVAGAAGTFLFLALKRALGRRRIHTLPYGYGIKVKKAITIDRPALDLYRYWRNLERLPRFVDHLEAVQVLGNGRSHWVISAPGGLRLEWDAEITVDRESEMIGWRSLRGGDIDIAGYVRFEPATKGRGTVVRIALQYNPPAGKAGAAVSALLGEKPEDLISEALRKFKNLMEAGEIATAQQRLPQTTEPVQVASEDSFPASDAPAWTGTTGP